MALYLGRSSCHVSDNCCVLALPQLWSHFGHDETMPQCMPSRKSADVWYTRHRSGRRLWRKLESNELYSHHFWYKCIRFWLGCCNFFEATSGILVSMSHQRGPHCFWITPSAQHSDYALVVVVWTPLVLLVVLKIELTITPTSVNWEIRKHVTTVKYSLEI